MVMSTTPANILSFFMLHALCKPPSGELEASPLTVSSWSAWSVWHVLGAHVGWAHLWWLLNGLSRSRATLGGRQGSG